MIIRLLAAFILIPLIELVLLLRLADLTSVGTTVVVVIGTGILGSLLARREGLMAWHRFRTALAQGRAPSREIQDGLMIVFAAALLLTPGLLTDAVGFTMLLPVGREAVRRWILQRYFKSFRLQVGGEPFERDPLHRNQRGSGYTIDAEAVQRK